MTVEAPATELELAALLTAQPGPFAVEGSGTRRGLGRPSTTGSVLSLRKFSGVKLYEPEELIFEAGAAIRLDDILPLLKKKRQHFAFEPPDLAHLWGGKGRGTLGGLVATGLSGPRRIQAGAVRDHVLGFTAVSGRGEIFKAGARVVKNVTGYDMPKLLTGSHGTLAAMTSIIMKVLPAPETEETLVVPVQDASEAIEVMTLALQSAGEVSAAAYVAGEGAMLRLEGITVSVAARRDLLTRLLGRKITVIDAAASQKMWAKIRDCRVFEHDPTHALWRISIAPSEGAVVVARISEQLSCRWYLDWGGGLIWLDVPCGPDAGASVVRQAIGSAGHALLVKAPDDVRQRVAVFQPQARALAALSARVKAAFDPAGKLNPGRMWDGI